MPSGPAAFVASGEEFTYLDSAGPPSQIANGLHCLIDLRLLSIDFRHNPGDGASVPGDDQSLAPLYVIE
jgi:hypothetical protein